MTDTTGIRRSYRTAFLRYLSRRDEAPLATGYELGRSAVAAGVSVLDLARVHHEVFLDVLRETSQDELTSVATAASEFFLEVLSTYDMAQRAFLDQSWTGPGTADASTASA